MNRIRKFWKEASTTKKSLVISISALVLTAAGIAYCRFSGKKGSGASMEPSVLNPGELEQTPGCTIEDFSVNK